jgi:hypothetical protein
MAFSPPSPQRTGDSNRHVLEEVISDQAPTCPPVEPRSSPKPAAQSFIRTRIPRQPQSNDQMFSRSLECAVHLCRRLPEPAMSRAHQWQ